MFLASAVSTRWRRVLFAASAAIVAIGLLGACGSDSQTDKGSCSKRIEFEGKTYAEMGGAGFTVGDRLGSSPLIACDDLGTPEKEPSPAQTQNLKVFGAVGVDTAIVIMAGETAQEATLFGVVDGQGNLSPEAKDLARRARTDGAQ